jgi:hypothetical protein
MNNKYTPEQLADRWHDCREVQNLMGKFVTAMQLKKDTEIPAAFWAGADDVSLGFNGGFYVGQEAVKGYFAYRDERTKAESAVIKSLFPEKTKGLTEKELYGVGQMTINPITTPLVELSGDGKTAKGLWHTFGLENGVTPQGALSYWKIGFVAADFIKEGDDWKLWHVLFATDVDLPMGDDWVAPPERPVQPEFASLCDVTMPEFTVKKENRHVYSTDRPFTPPPQMPEPYETFGETFSYGI